VRRRRPLADRVGGFCPQGRAPHLQPASCSSRRARAAGATLSNGRSAHGIRIQRWCIEVEGQEREGRASQIRAVGTSVAAAVQPNRGSRRWRGRPGGSSPRCPLSPSPPLCGTTRGWPPLASHRRCEGGDDLRASSSDLRRRLLPPLRVACVMAGSPRCCMQVSQLLPALKFHTHVVRVNASHRDEWSHDSSA
jgi:hypothetical protein